MTQTISHPLVHAGQRPISLCDVAAAERACIPQPTTVLKEAISRLTENYSRFQTQETCSRFLAVGSVVLLPLSKIVGLHAQTWLRTIVIATVAALVFILRAAHSRRSAKEADNDYFLLQYISMQPSRRFDEQESSTSMPSNESYTDDDVTMLQSRSTFWKGMSQRFEEQVTAEQHRLQELEKAASSNQSLKLYETHKFLAESFDRKQEALCAKMRAAFYQAVLTVPPAKSQSIPRSSDAIFSFKKVSSMHIWNAQTAQELRAAVKQLIDDELVHCETNLKRHLTWNFVQVFPIEIIAGEILAMIKAPKSVGV